jgi:MerR family transcriptional regulator, thiopeptide resistance regulator
MQGWTVGQLARRTGITVRTLHHYDEVGLLTPSQRNGSGYRLYGEADVVRLQQILSLRQLGLPLAEIRACLTTAGLTPLRVVEMHLARVRQQLDLQQKLAERLEALARQLRSAEAVSVEEFLRAMEMMTMFEKYYTPEQLKELEERRLQLGEERIREVEAAWPTLMAEVRAEMERGTDPADERVRRLAERWSALVAEFTGGDPGIQSSLSRMYQQEPTVAGMDAGPMREMAEYLARARAAGGQG